jgi:hypothetical protein
VISLMAFESLDFKYNKNHFPGVAGQGSTSITTPQPCQNSKLSKLYGCFYIESRRNKLTATSPKHAIANLQQNIRLLPTGTCRQTSCRVRLPG